MGLSVGIRLREGARLRLALLPAAALGVALSTAVVTGRLGSAAPTSPALTAGCVLEIQLVCPSPTPTPTTLSVAPVDSAASALASAVATAPASPDPGPVTASACTLVCSSTPAVTPSVCVGTLCVNPPASPPASAPPPPQTCLSGAACLGGSCTVSLLTTCPPSDGGTPPPGGTSTSSSSSGSGGGSAVAGSGGGSSTGLLGLGGGADPFAQGPPPTSLVADAGAMSRLITPTARSLGILDALRIGGGLGLWPLFLVLDVLAAAGLVVLVRRTWSAAPAG